MKKNLIRSRNRIIPIRKLHSVFVERCLAVLDRLSRNLAFVATLME